MSLPSRSRSSHILTERNPNQIDPSPCDFKFTVGSEENSHPTPVVYSTATCDDSFGSSNYRPNSSVYFKPLTTGHTTPFYRTRESIWSYGSVTVDYRGPDLFTKLSDEIFLLILANLPCKSLCRASQVSRRWGRLCKSSELWTRLDMANKRVTVAVVLEYLSRGVKVFRLAKAELMEEQPVTIPVPKAVKNLELGSTEPHKVTHWDLSMMVNCNPNALAVLLKNCHNLVALSLEHLELNLDCAVHFQHFVDLEYLNLAMCSGITPQVITMLLMRCNKLKELNLAWCNLDRATVLVTVSVLPESLERLNLSGCRFATLTDAEVQTICRQCPNLKELDLSDTSDITADSMSHIIRHLKRLEILSLSRCYNINPLAYTWIEYLKELNIYGTLTEESIVALRARLPVGTQLNSTLFSTVARPTTGMRRTSIWGEQTRDDH